MDSDTKSFYCRLCAELQPEYNLIEINDEKAINFNLAHKIAHCYNIKINADDLLPKHVCSSCCNQVISSYDFHEQVHKAQETLIKRLVNIKQENEALASLPISTPLPTSNLQFDSINSFNLTSASQIKNDDFDYGANFLAYAKIEPDSDTNSSLEDEKPLIERQNDLKKGKLKRKKGKPTRNNKWKCAECNEVETSGKKLRMHYLTKHNKPPVFTCPNCPKSYSRYDSYLAHVRTHNGRYVCDICGNNYRDRGYLKQHIKLHSDITPYLCPDCNKTFKTAKLLKSHQRSHLPLEEKKKFECDECDKKFTTKAHLNFHKECHSTTEPEKNFVCDQCGRNFKRKGTLIQHISTHLEVYLFRCDKCPKAFKDVYGLRRHQKNHIDGIFFKCEICLRPFKHKRALKRHTSIHTNKLPYECEYCKKCFREKSYLKIHLRQHTGEKPYSCTQCNQHFTNDSNFIKHIRGRHGLEHFSIANQRQFPFVNNVN